LALFLPLLALTGRGGGAGGDLPNDGWIKKEGGGGGLLES